MGSIWLFFLCYLVYSLPTSPVPIEEEKLGIILLEKSSLAPLHSGWNFLKQSNKESIIYIINCADWLRGGHLRLQNKMLRWKIWDQQSLCLRQTSLRDAVATTCTNHVTPARKKYWLPDCKKYWLWNVLSQSRPLSVSFLFRASGKSQICNYIFFDCDIQGGSTSHNLNQSSADNFNARPQRKY